MWKQGPRIFRIIWGEDDDDDDDEDDDDDDDDNDDDYDYSRNCQRKYLTFLTT